MFEKEIEQLLTTISRDTIGEGKSVGLRHIFESKIPAGVKTFFKAEVEWILANERKNERRPARFNYDQPEIRLLQEQIDALLVNNFVFAKTDFEATLDKSIHFLFNYLCRPQWTLMSFMFEASVNAISARTIQRKLRFCRDYKYFRDIIQRYITHHTLNEVTFDAMKALLPRIDQEVLKNHTPDQIAEMTKTLFDFVSYARNGWDHAEEHSVPTRALIYFFDDKGMTTMSGALRQRKEVEKKTEISLNELVFILESQHTPEPTPSAYIPTPRFLETPKDLQVHNGKVFGEDEDHVEAAETMLSHAAPQPISPLFSYESERAIIRSVFGGSDDDFRLTIERVLSSATWQDAALVLEEFFDTHQVEPFTSEAVTFTNILQAAFAGQ
jgi:hypothetical protein